ncbi:TonB-dependent receptor [Sphingomonas endophytica]|uniref:TonB-dependent receptor n=2 Tax=Sphingomonas endophytica TaxID=869719 RepID=A0A147I575_9SPHN|nr:TonB-dependent receptor [Sphingomonas endophytica]
MAGSAMLAALTPGVARAETPAAAPADATTPAAADDVNGVPDVVVTATRRETNLQKTPIAISVVDPQVIKDRHIQSLIDLADGAIPSLRVATFEARQSALTVGIRGIVPFDQNQTARDTGVGVYIDGVNLGRSQGLNAALFDVERVEVLRGPQGTLFGRNTEGGALSIVTKAPTGEFDGRATAGFGNYGQYTGELHLDLPEIANIAFKLDGLVQHQNATTTNPLPGNYGWNYYNRYGGRLSALWKPVDGLSILVAYDQAHDENTPFYSQLVTYNPKNLPVGSYTGTKLVCPAGAATCIAPLPALVQAAGDRRMKAADIGVPQQLSVDKTHGLSSTIKYEITPDLELRSITAWRGVDTSQWDNSGGAHRTVFVPNGKFSRYSLSDLRQNQFSQELQLVGHAGGLDYVAGLYYYTERAEEAAATPSSNQWNADGTGYTILSPIVTGTIASGNQGWAYGSRYVQRDSWAKAHSYAAFAQATWTPAGADALHLTVGGRYTKDKRKGVLFTVQNKPTNYGFRFDNGRFDPMATIAYDLTPNAHVYAKYATGYRAGGANDRSQTFASFGPESIKSYEVGAKMDLFDRRVRLNLAGYIMDRKGTQTDFDNVDTRQFLADGVTPNPTFNLHTEETRNAPGMSRIRGIEADLTVRPVDGVTLGGAYSYTYTHVPATPNPFLNNALYQVYVVYTPRNAASAYADYEVPVGGGDTKLRFHIDGNYGSSVYSFQNESTKTDPTFIVNGRIALADIRLNDHGQRFTLAAWSRNLFNNAFIYRRSAANALVLGDYANFNAPRTMGLEGTINF